MAFVGFEQSLYFPTAGQGNEIADWGIWLQLRMCKVLPTAGLLFECAYLAFEYGVTAFCVPPNTGH